MLYFISCIAGIEKKSKDRQATHEHTTGIKRATKLRNPYTDTS
jgi:hypothetical protein